MKTRPLLFAGWMLLAGANASAQAPPDVDGQAIRDVLEGVRRMLEGIERLPYTADLRSPEIDALIGAKLGGLPLMPRLTFTRDIGVNSIKASLPDIPEPFRSKAELKMNDSMAGQFALRVLRDINGNFILALFRSLMSEGQFDIIRFDETRAVVEFNDIAESFNGKVIRSARFSFDLRTMTVDHLRFWMGGGGFLDLGVQLSPDAYFPGTRMPFVTGVSLSQKGFPGPEAASVKFENYQFASASDPAAVKKLTEWKAALVLAGLPDWRAEGLQLDPDGRARLDLRKAPVTDLSMLRGLPLKSLDLSETKVTDLSPLRDLPLEVLVLDSTPVTDLSPLRGAKLASLSLRNLKVRDLSPLAGMPLKSLDLQGTPPFDSLAPFAGMQLEALSVENYPIKDLSPLKGMPLRELNVSGTKIEDLAPLAGMPLRKLLLARTQAADLTPLAGAPIEELDLADCKAIKDIAPLKGMPLRILHLTRVTRIRDITPLAGAKLEHLNLASTEVADLAPLAGMPLRYLSLHRTKARDIAPLAGMPLTELNLGFCEVKDLHVLAGMRIEILNIDQVPAPDITMLKGMPLRRLNLGKHPLDDLRLLAGMPLQQLELAGCPNIRDLSPLAGMRIDNLHLGHTNVTDLAPLRSLPLRWLLLHGSKATALGPLADCREIETITIPLNATGVEALRGLPKLREITASDGYPQQRMPAAKFWESYDAAKDSQPSDSTRKENGK